MFSEDMLSVLDVARNLQKTHIPMIPLVHKVGGASVGDTHHLEVAHVVLSADEKLLVQQGGARRFRAPLLFPSPPSTVQAYRSSRASIV